MPPDLDGNTEGVSAQSRAEHTPVRRLRTRRDSMPVPTELVDAANPIAVAFHLSASLAESDATHPAALANYWGVGRRKAREAKDVLVAHGLWIEVEVSQPFGAGRRHEIRTVETRATERDLVELAMEYPAKTLLKTAGRTWQITAEGALATTFGHEGAPLATESGHEGHEGEVFPGQPQETESGHEGAPLATESGHEGEVFPGQPQETESGHEGAPLNKRKKRSFASQESEACASLKRDVASLRKASDAAPNDDDPLTREVVELVRRLPWERTSSGRTPGVEQLAEREIVPAIVAAVRRYAGRGVTVDYASDLALQALRDGDKGRDGGKKRGGTSLVRYVAGAFSDEHLKLPPRADALPLPDHKQPANGPETAAGATNGPGGSDGAPATASGSQGESERPSRGQAAGDQPETGETEQKTLVTPERIATTLRYLEERRAQRVREQHARERHDADGDANTA